MWIIFYYELKAPGIICDGIRLMWGTYVQHHNGKTSNLQGSITIFRVSFTVSQYMFLRIWAFKEWSKGYGFEEFYTLLHRIFSITVIDTVCSQFSKEDMDKIFNSLIHWKVKNLCPENHISRSYRGKGSKRWKSSLP